MTTSFEDYNSTVMDHFLNPRNTGEVQTPTHSATVTNPKCGDMMKLTVRVDVGRIEEVRAKTFGCAAAIACSSVLTEWLQGLPLEDVRRITNSAIASRLGGLPDYKMECSVVAEQAIQEAFGPTLTSLPS